MSKTRPDGSPFTPDDLEYWDKPYTFQAFPKVLYRRTITTSGTIDAEERIVATEAEENLAKAEGWFDHPQAATDAANSAQREQQDRERHAADRHQVEVVKQALMELARHAPKQAPSRAVDRSGKPRRRRRTRRKPPESKPTNIPSFGQQLKQAMNDARVSVSGLVAATAEAKTPITRRTIERLRADERPPRIDTVGAFEAALTKARNGVPFRFLFPTASRQRREPRPSRKRSQKAATRR